MGIVEIKKIVTLNICFAVSVVLFITVVVSVNVNIGLNILLQGRRNDFESGGA